MKRAACCSGALLLLLLGLALGPVTSPCSAATGLGDTLEGLSLNAPASETMRQYLGLTGTEPFGLDALPSRLTVIEIFSTTCAACYKNAPKLNKLYGYIQKNSRLSKEVRMLAVGQGDDARKLKIWQRKLRIRYPLLMDSGKETQQAFGNKGTPHFLVVDRAGKIHFSHAGPIQEVEGFVKTLKGLLDAMEPAR